MERTQKPSISRATLRGDGHLQAEDLQALAKARRKYDQAVAQLDPATYAPAHIAAKRSTLLADLHATTADVVERVNSRAAQATAALTMWTPARRRLDATLADPVTAAAIASRLALVHVTQLPAVARTAAEQGDWLTADAVACQLDRLQSTLTTDAAPLVADIQQTLDAMDGEASTEAVSLATAIRRDGAAASILAAEIAGQPLSAAERLTLGHEFPDLTIPTAE